MTLERFQMLAEAYGGSLTRWPVGEQDAAFALLAASPDEAGAILAEARDLDEALDAAERLSPTFTLRQSVIAAAPRARPVRAPARRWFAGAGVGIGLAAVAVAGVMIGVNLSVTSAGEDAVVLAAAYSAGMVEDAGGDS
ncbi:MAG: hypothetical protein ACOYM5_12125 [Caulobacter sp.]